MAVGNDEIYELKFNVSDDLDGVPPFPFHVTVYWFMLHCAVHVMSLFGMVRGMGGLHPVKV